MKTVLLSISAIFLCIASANAQESDSFRAGIYGGATIYPGFTGLAGLDFDYRVSTRVSTGVRISIIDILGPCSDADPVVYPNLCIADGRIYAGFISFLTESKRRRTEPYVELGLGAYHYTDEIKTGKLAPYAEAGVGLEVWRLRIGLRYGRILDSEVEEMVHGKFAYFTPILGVNIPF